MNEISVVIPITHAPFFVQATLENIKQTTSQKIDTTFVVPEDVDVGVLKAFEKSRSTYDFRILEAPFSVGKNEGALIDYAVRNDLIAPWILVQHCGVFWTENDWYEWIVDSLDPDLTAICPLQFSSYRVDTSPVMLAGSFLGLYHREKLIERNMSFRWGHWGTEIGISPNLREAFSLGRITRWNTPVALEEWADMGVALSLELATAESDCLGALDLTLMMIYLFGFFQIESAISVQNNVVKSEIPCNDSFHIEKSTWISAFAVYSYITSMLFEREDVRCPLPWILFQRFAEGNDLSQPLAACEWIKSFSSLPQNPLGLDDCGLRLELQ